MSGGRSLIGLKGGDPSKGSYELLLAALMGAVELRRS
jgi:hypothetical protein